LAPDRDRLVCHGSDACADHWEAQIEGVKRPLMARAAQDADLPPIGFDAQT
jgi:hypothetical protein